jgi:hypothetical protein
LGYVSVWKVLEEMVADFRGKGMTIPPQVMSDLKSAKTTIRVLSAGTQSEDGIRRVDQYLMNVESYLITEGQKKLGQRYIDEWLERLDNASREKTDGEQEVLRFIPGMPRQQKWIRVTPTAGIHIKTLEATAVKMKLSHKIGEDSSLLVWGDDRAIKDFVKNLASKYEGQGEKYRKKVHNG